MIIEHPNEFNIGQLENLFLWKYLDLYKLLDLITTGELYFTRFDHFEDGLEGLTGKAIKLMAFTQGQPLCLETIDKALSPERQLREIQDDRDTRQKLQSIINDSQKTQFANCWFLDDRESLSMWKIYSKKEGIALKFNAKQLTELIIAAAKNLTNSNFKILYYGKVNYKKIWPYGIHEKFEEKFNGLKKDRSYSSESEFRFVAVTPRDKAGVHSCFRLPFGDLKNVELEVIANPFMEAWQFNILKDLLQKYDLENKLTTSKMKIKK
jgi:hypothetical protein